MSIYLINNTDSLRQDSEWTHYNEKLAGLDKALAYYDTLKTFSTEAGFDQGISTARTNSADIYKYKGDFSKAQEMAMEAEKYFGENPCDQILNENYTL